MGMNRFWLAWILASPVWSQDPGGRSGKESWPVKLTGAHYEILSTAEKKQAERLLQHMELVFQTYTKLLALARTPSQRMTLVLYKDFAEYRASGAPGGSVAYYDGRRLVGYYNPKTMYNYFAHEGFHQFTDVGIKAIHKAPSWFTEGMAECIGNSVVRDKKLYMCAKDGVIARENIGTIRRAVRENRHVPLERLLSMGDGAFMSESDLLYPESWSFCHFLMAYPNYEDPKCQIPNGKYWTVLSQYIQLLSKGSVKPRQALEGAFVLKGKKLDLHQLESEWKAYILQWPDSGEDE